MSTTDRSWRLRRADPHDTEDRARVIALLADYHRIEGVRADAAARFAWIHEGNPHGRALTWLAEDAESGRCVGMASLFPRFVIAAGREWLAAIGGDTFVLPEWRRRGIAARLQQARHAEGLAPRASFGVPTASNAGPLRVAGTSNSGVLRRFVLPGPGARGLRGRTLRAASSLARRRGRALARGCEALEWRRGDERLARAWEDFAEEARGRATSTTRRDAEYYAWRFLDAPSGRHVPLLVERAGRVLGFGALELGQGEAAIVDVCARREARAATLATLAREAESRVSGLRALHGFAHSASEHCAALRALGFLARESRPFTVSGEAGSAERRALERASSWCVSAADGDVDRVLREA